MGIPTLLYILLWIEPVHEKLRALTAEQLSGLLDAEVTIGHLRVLPLNRVELSNIAITAGGDTLLTARELNAGVSVRNLLLRRRLVVTDVELMNPDVRLRRDSASAPLNVQPIITKLKGDGSKPPSTFDLAVHTVVVRSGRGSYNVDSAPRKSGFDPNHLQLTGFNADLTAPRISNGNIAVSLKRFAIVESSGLRIRRLAANVSLKDSLLRIDGLTLRLNDSELRFAPMALNLRGDEIGDVRLLAGSMLCPADAAPIVPQLAEVASPLMVQAKVKLLRDSLNVESLELNAPSRALYVHARSRASRLRADAPRLELGVNGSELARTIGLFAPVKPEVSRLLESLGSISFVGSAGWHKPADATLRGRLTSAAGTINVDASLVARRLRASAGSRALNLALIAPGKELGMADFEATVDLTHTAGRAALTIDRLDWRGHSFRNIDATGAFKGRAYTAALVLGDSAVAATAAIDLDLTPDAVSASVVADVDSLRPAVFGILPKYAGHTASARIHGKFQGPELTEPTGQLTVTDLKFLAADGSGLREEPIVLQSDFRGDKQSIALSSDLIDVSAAGSINLKTIGAAARNMLAASLPQYFEPQPTDSLRPNDFTFAATVHDDAPLLRFISSPMELLYPVSLTGEFSETRNRGRASLSAPYISKGNSLISHSRLEATLGATSKLALHTVMPSKFGDMTFNVDGTLTNGPGCINISFSNNEARSFAADMVLDFMPLPGGLDLNIRPGILTIGGVDWELEPAYVGCRGKSTIIHGFGISRPGQELTINGVVSSLADDRLTVGLDNVNVDYIFETLRMNPSVRFGGDATGTVVATGVLSAEPVLHTNDLFVRNFSYGNCVMGDASIRSRWNNETRGIEIHADVANSAISGSTTTVDGKIYPLTSTLDFIFLANHTPVSFIHTFTKAWASAISGTASGRAHLFGDFKHVDLEGDLVAEDFGLTVGFTNVTYSANDSVHIRPGIIDLTGITVTDPEGHSAKLSGALTHRHFLEAFFKFRVDDMNNMLVLNTVPTSDEDFWYGTVHANGTVEINGVPGLVTISANARTAPGSDFTFVISDAANAAEYTFLTFRDATPRAPVDSTTRPGSPELDELMRARVAKAAQLADATNFNFDMQVDVTPDARMTLVMDPDAGDKITGTGAGHIGLVYGSQTDEFRLYGDYRIEKGDYNFSLQDIILKNFQIRPGSEIAFSGDPMNARLNISANYQVNANLSDLDESFLNDKEVQRTNVPVYAVLNVNGQLEEPQISFDLDFPTLTSDVKRKVKSIVSTDEMMNRQIIYLLALNRFYTPDYMTATKGNDLMSVASGTISSQLSNMLGQLSDKISVAPSLRTDNGDFSDVEVDVALSSTLLNNRLLLNGNFGYRDKALNSNQFIGDFDIEYLLTRQGNWRLKAYNHFNDRNLYVKTALTTQGVGLVFKHDFDNLFRNIWKSRKKSLTLQP